MKIHTLINHRTKRKGDMVSSMIMAAFTQYILIPLLGCVLFFALVAITERMGIV